MSQLSQYLPFAPSAEQVRALQLLENFLADEDDFFILKGSAGTGKTSLMNAFARYVSEQKWRLIISAPTGRAAHIIGQKTKRTAGTIHSLIYTPQASENSPAVYLIRKDNPSEERTVFIVDVASMVSDRLDSEGTFRANAPLLTDFIDFVRQGNPKNKIVFVGDDYQLRPVGEDFSAALNEDYLATHFGLKGVSLEITEVKRQEEGSQILQMATHVRDAIAGNGQEVTLSIGTFPNDREAIGRYIQEIDLDRLDKITILAWTNKDVNRINRRVRQALFRNPATLQRGDLVILEKNWFHKSNYLYKGESGVVVELNDKIEEVEGLKFQTVGIRFPIKGIFTAKVVLDMLTAQRPELPQEALKALHTKAMKTNKAFRDSKKPADDPYLGAMQLRYAYAITCHKAQGGEWDEVLLSPYIPTFDFRWVYTAITRAAKSIYFMSQRTD